MLPLNYILFVLLSVTGGLAAARAEDSFSDLEARLGSFHADPVRVMNETPQKHDLSGKLLPPQRDPRLDPRAKPAELLKQKDQVRARLAARAVAPSLESVRIPVPGATTPSESLAAIPGANDRVEALLPSLSILRNMQQMEAQGLLVGRAARAPWSDAYWPLDRGMIGTRYTDPEFTRTANWAEARAYVVARPPESIVASGDPARWAQLSPSEKYDWIVGDSTWNLTKHVWGRGQVYNDKYGKVDYWMGICEGWALASIMVPQPMRTVQVPVASGGSIPFYPSDIRALASLLWSTGRYQVRLVGNRCSIQNPPKDAVGRITAQECFDTNPATWHLAAVNEIGLNKGAFIFDSTFDFEVWNQPVYGYKYTYFNPQSLKRVSTLREAAIPVTQFARDKFRAYRSPNARYVVGVGMEVTYVMETVPTSQEGGRSAGRTVQYIYDLELDGNMNIIGGEWYTNLHPDFLWASIDGTRAQSFVDAQIQPSLWDGVGPVPSLWTSLAQKASAVVQPLGAVVDRLVERSK